MYLVFDLETGSTEFKGRKGSPWANEILAVGLKYSDERVYTPDSEKIPGEDYTLFAHAQDYMPTGWLHGVTVLIGHNIKFDLLHTWRNNELQEAFKNGLRIWDTQLAEYILSGQRHKYSSLRDIATRIYGCTERTKKIEGGLKAGLMTQYMDIEDLLFDVKNDVLDTEKIALQQVKSAKLTGMYGLIAHEMDALLSTTEMEANGLYVNKEILTKNKLDLQIEYEHKAKQFQKLCSQYWR